MECATKDCREELCWFVASKGLQIHGTPPSVAKSIPRDHIGAQTMLWFFHPKPPSRKETAMQVVEQKGTAVVDTRVIVIDGPRNKNADADKGEIDGASDANTSPTKK
jgi:hypothetical protein